jgi:hypothetical protein
MENVNGDPIVKIMTLVIQEDRSFHLYVLDKKVPLAEVKLPKVVHDRNLKTVATVLEAVTICQGLNQDSYIQYLERRKGNIYNIQGKLSAYLDETLKNGTTNEDYPQGSTVRASNCSMLIMTGKSTCKNCKAYENPLSTMAKRDKPGTTYCNSNLIDEYL